ncbi:MAG: imidazole glycerol phosphate synthase subunit HisH [Candidatus Margulisbacteria bacterium]|nr:imidazole glycerol phosphate synthase subunit HisH [Candidatus Margulisiibacteriota bacterium]
MITIIDLDLCNLGSVLNMLKKIGKSVTVLSSAEDLKVAKKIILPGVGSFDNAMKNLNESGLKELLIERVITDKVPILGICLGMQLLTNGSEEGHESGLGFIDAQTIKFQSDTMKIPHMGWNSVTKKKSHALIDNLEEDARFYFVHSYYVKCENPTDTLTTTNYICEFDSAIQKDNVMGVQFHPEKSHQFGMQLMKNFAELADA